jgi:hypothetical protein
MLLLDEIFVRQSHYLPVSIYSRILQLELVQILTAILASANLCYPHQHQ